MGHPLEFLFSETEILYLPVIINRLKLSSGDSGCYIFRGKIDVFFKINTARQKKSNFLLNMFMSLYEWPLKQLWVYMLPLFSGIDYSWRGY